MFLVAGIPRASTTLAAKLISLTDEIFCYAGETHLIPFLYRYFQFLPCHPLKVEHILKELELMLTSTMLEAPRYNISQGAHPGNLIFNQVHIESLINQIQPMLKDGTYGLELYQSALGALENVLSDTSTRSLLGEKTPDNLFALASHPQIPIKSLIAVREPFGVLRSMAIRVKNNDPYSGVFSGGVESNIGIYLEYMQAVEQVCNNKNSHLVRFEDLANNPANTVTNMYKHFNVPINDAVLSFVEKGANQSIADKAPMYYQRLKLKTDCTEFALNDRWKILNLTRDEREKIGYTDQALINLGFDLSSIKFQGSVKDSLIPLYGFNTPDISPSRLWNKQTINRWMKSRAKLIFYAKKIRKLQLKLNFISAFPENLLKNKQATLKIKINNQLLTQIEVAAGFEKSSRELIITDKMLDKMGNESGYLMIDLEPDLAFCPAAHSEKNWDVRTLSFQLTTWSIKNL